MNEETSDVTHRASTAARGKTCLDFILRGTGSLLYSIALFIHFQFLSRHHQTLTMFIIFRESGYAFINIKTARFSFLKMKRLL